MSDLGKRDNLDRETEILLKAWETFQDIAASNGRAAWTIRAWGVSVWCALVTYAFAPGPKAIAWIAIVELIVAFLMELAARQIQYAFIGKSLAIERTLQAIAIGERHALPEMGISTNSETPTVRSLAALLTLRRWLIWFPYLALFIASIVVLSL